MQILYFMTLNACIASHHIVWVFCPLCTCLHFAASCADDGGRGGALCGAPGEFHHPGLGLGLGLRFRVTVRVRLRVRDRDRVRDRGGEILRERRPLLLSFS